MLEWKHLQLSSQDYQNYINNEDEENIKLNDLNIQEWQQLYHQTQTRSLMNKNIKKSILKYENNLKKLSGESHIVANPKQLLKLYVQYNCEIKTILTELYEQLGLLHLNNISTTVQFVISRLLSTEEDLFNMILQNNIKLRNLRQQLFQVECSRKRNVCTQCTEHFQKIRNKYLKNQIIAVQEPQQDVEKQKTSENYSEKIRQYMREQIILEEHEYEIERYNYMNSVQEALKNKEKTLRYSNSPLQNILTDYLHEILTMLQTKKLNFAPKSINEFERVNRSYETIQDMKKLFKHEQFIQHISALLSQPFSDFAYKIQRKLKGFPDHTKGITVHVQTQTIFISQFDQLRNLERQNTRMMQQLESLKSSKMKMQNDILQNLQTSRRYETKFLFLSNKNKQLQAQNKKLELQVHELQLELSHIHIEYKTEKANIIDTIGHQKNSLVTQKKRLQIELQKMKDLKEGVTRVEYQVQTDNQIFQQFMKQYAQKTKSSNFKKRTHKKLSIKLLDQNKQVKYINLEQNYLKSSKKIMKKSPHQAVDARLSQQSKLSINGSNSTKLMKVGKISKQAISLKVSRVNPLKQPIKQQYQSAKQQLNLRKSAKLVQPIEERSLSKVKTQRINVPFTGHGYHKSQLTNRDLQISIQREPQNIFSARAKTQLSNKVLNFSRFKQNVQFSSQNNFKRQLKEDSKRKKLEISEFQEQTQANPISQFDKGGDVKLQEKQESLKSHVFNRVSQAERIKSFINFCEQNYEQLQKVNAFKMFQVQALKIHKIKYSQKKFRSSLEQRTEMANHTQRIQTDILVVKKQAEELFISADMANKYQLKANIWNEIDGCIMIDNNFSSICEQIQNFFLKLKANQPQVYKHYLIFLNKPYSYLTRKHSLLEPKNADFINEMIENTQRDKNWVRHLFRRLFKTHQIMHKQCNHIQVFLQTIGFPVK